LLTAGLEASLHTGRRQRPLAAAAVVLASAGIAARGSKPEDTQRVCGPAPAVFRFAQPVAGGAPEVVERKLSYGCKASGHTCAAGEKGVAETLGISVKTLRTLYRELREAVLQVSPPLTKPNAQYNNSLVGGR
jgi:transcription initiation factor TFIIIB Brf1 subunit/transcription initiation factor TFIIB